MAVATSIGIALLIGAAAGGTAATVAAKKRAAAERQAALDAQQKQNDTVAPPPPPTPPDATRSASDAMIQARQASVRVRRRMGGNTGVNGGRIPGPPSSTGSPLPVVRPRQLTPRPGSGASLPGGPGSPLPRQRLPYQT